MDFLNGLIESTGNFRALRRPVAAGGRDAERPRQLRGGALRAGISDDDPAVHDARSLTEGGGIGKGRATE